MTAHFSTTSRSRAASPSPNGQRPSNRRRRRRRQPKQRQSDAPPNDEVSQGDSGGGTIPTTRAVTASAGTARARVVTARSRESRVEGGRGSLRKSDSTESSTASSLSSSSTTEAPIKRRSYFTWTIIMALLSFVVLVLVCTVLLTNLHPTSGSTSFVPISWFQNTQTTTTTNNPPLPMAPPSSSSTDTIATSEVQATTAARNDDNLEEETSLKALTTQQQRLQVKQYKLLHPVRQVVRAFIEWATKVRDILLQPTNLLFRRHRNNQKTTQQYHNNMRHTATIDPETIISTSDDYCDTATVEKPELTRNDASSNVAREEARQDDTLLQQYVRLYPTAYTSPPQIDTVQRQVLQHFSNFVHQAVSNGEQQQLSLSDRLSRVPWGGIEAWWDPARNDGSIDNRKRNPPRGGGGGDASTLDDDADAALDEIDGGRLLYSYYKIMQVAQHKHNKNTNAQLTDLSSVHFPLGACRPNASGGGGCPASFAIQHTLQWREIYQPWKVDPTVISENVKGWIYTRGFSPPAPSRRSNRPYGQHAILWARPGLHRSVDGVAYVRALLHSADLAVANSLRASSGRVGKFNVIVDVRGYEWGRSLPALSHLKHAVSLLQDHFPDRLGVVAIMHLSRTSELVLNLIKPWLTKEVRDKIHTIHNVDQLSALVEPQYIPHWLNGPDQYAFHPDEYYPPHIRFSTEVARAYYASPALS